MQVHVIWKQKEQSSNNKKVVLTLLSESELMRKGISSGKWGAIPVKQPKIQPRI